MAKILLVEDTFDLVYVIVREPETSVRQVVQASISELDEITPELSET
ncbi:MAG TPA: hypothetical protein VLG46_07675 [Anaerolineae bacterium]|nr:hypothetical protein [Anaerolineae bacterium]